MFFKCTLNLTAVYIILFLAPTLNITMELEKESNNKSHYDTILSKYSSVLYD